MSEYTFTLTRQQYERLLLALAFATSAAYAQKDERLAYQFLNLVNEINQDNPNWTPYEIPAERKEQ